ncbi:MAG: type II toxin-antitoxin system death-on-curing family toxin [Candidatus Thiodiazotropha sp. LLP2]
MKEPVWVLHEVVIAVHQSLLAEHGGASGIRDEALLDSALNRPRQRFEYSDAPSIFDLTASYCHGLANNHPFIDGNKRIALTIAALFLELNGYSLIASEPSAVVIIEELAAGNLPEDDLSTWFREYCVSNA